MSDPDILSHVLEAYTYHVLIVYIQMALELSYKIKSACWHTLLTPGGVVRSVGHVPIVIAAYELQHVSYACANKRISYRTEPEMEMSASLVIDMTSLNELLLHLFNEYCRF